MLTHIVRALFWTAALICLLVLMAPTLARAARCARHAPTMGVWADCLGKGLTAPFKTCYELGHEPLRRGAAGSLHQGHD